MPEHKNPVVDPVCGMTVRPETAPTSTYEGRVYYFCSAECQREFESDPARYADRGAAVDPQEPPFTKSGDWVSPKFGSAGSGGAEYEPLPHRRPGSPEP